MIFRVGLVVLTVGLSLGAGHALGSLGIKYMSHTLDTLLGSSPPAPPAPPPAAPVRQKVSRRGLDPLLTANVFQALRRPLRSAAPPPPPKPKVAAPPPPPPAPGPPPLTLHGVSILAYHAFAFISEGSSRQQRVYRVGDCVPAARQPPGRRCSGTQGRIVEVQGEQVLLSVPGNKQLALNLKQGNTSVSRPRPLPQAAARPRPAPKAPRSSNPGAPFPSEQSGDTVNVYVPGQEVQQAFENFTDILRQARVVPYKKGSVRGFQIRSIKPNSVFARLHLKNYDVITAVNGQEVATADQALQLFSAFRNDRQVALGVYRGKSRLSMNYNIQ